MRQFAGAESPPFRTNRVDARMRLHELAKTCVEKNEREHRAPCAAIADVRSGGGDGGAGGRRTWGRVAAQEYVTQSLLAV